MCTVEPVFKDTPDVIVAQVYTSILVPCIYGFGFWSDGSWYLSVMSSRQYSPVWSLFCLINTPPLADWLWCCHGAGAGHAQWRQSGVPVGAEQCLVSAARLLGPLGARPGGAVVPDSWRYARHGHPYLGVGGEWYR